MFANISLKALLLIGIYLFSGLAAIHVIPAWSVWSTLAVGLSLLIGKTSVQMYMTKQEVAEERYNEAFANLFARLYSIGQKPIEYQIGMWR